MPTTILTALGVHVYYVPGFHEGGALVRDLGAAFIRSDLSPDDLRCVVGQLMDCLLLNPAPGEAPDRSAR